MNGIGAFFSQNPYMIAINWIAGVAGFGFVIIPMVWRWFKYLRVTFTSSWREARRRSSYRRARDGLLLATHPSFYRARTHWVLGTSLLFSLRVVNIVADGLPGSPMREVVGEDDRLFLGTTILAAMLLLVLAFRVLYEFLSMAIYVQMIVTRRERERRFPSTRLRRIRARRSWFEQNEEVAKARL